jgi:hypothetical protein
MIASCNCVRSRVKPLLMRPDMETTAAISDSSNDAGQHQRGRFLGLRQITGAHMHVVEQENNETLRHTPRLLGSVGTRRPLSRTGITLNRRRTLLDGEPGNRLRLVVVEKLEVFFFQVTDRVALAIADEHRNQDDVYLAFDRERPILRSGFFLPCGQSRAQDKSQAGSADSRETSCVGFNWNPTPRWVGIRMGALGRRFLALRLGGQFARRLLCHRLEGFRLKLTVLLQQDFYFAFGLFQFLAARGRELHAFLEQGQGFLQGHVPVFQLLHNLQIWPTNYSCHYSNLRWSRAGMFPGLPEHPPRKYIALRVR